MVSPDLSDLSDLVSADLRSPDLRQIFIRSSDLRLTLVFDQCPWTTLKNGATAGSAHTQVQEMASIFSRIYDFDRFWCPVEGMIELDHYGYLRDPETNTDWMGQPDTLPYEYIEDVPCLILLGEPGIGKSLWFRQRKDTLTAKIRDAGSRDLWVDLGAYDQAPDVVEAVFHDEEFVQWHQGVYRLHLFLDGFDGCLSHVRVLPKRFLTELQKYPVERLCLRVLCRTPEWPKTLEDGLKELWGQCYDSDRSSRATEVSENAPTEDQASCPVQLFELTPLRRRDVEEMVKGEGLDPESLLKEIESKDLVPFAIKPQTLAFLLKTYKSYGRFPSTQVELYRQGCRELCREPNLERVDAGISREFSTDDRLALASRIAAFTMFGNRPSIPRYDIPANEIKDTDIALGDVLHGTERVGCKELSVTEDLILETLNTGLFAGRPGNRMGWAHQTYAEFLAAEYLVRNEVPVGTIMRLIQHPHDPEGKIPPTLGETASWLSLMKQEAFEAVMASDPEILLLKRHERTTAEEPHDVRRRLVGTLLKLMDEGRLLDHRISRMARLSDLDHPGLADQLLPYIEDSEKNFVVRRVAIALAEENCVSELQHAVCDVALNPEDHYLVRKPAVRAVLAIGSEDEKARLKPLAFGQRGEDPDDELKGYALTALWPDHITAQELFESLRAPNNPNHWGRYQAFLSDPLVDRMTPSHLPDALRWVSRQERQDPRLFSFEDLIDSIMAYAWQQLDSPGVLDEFARAALHRLEYSDGIAPSRSKGREDSVIFEDDSKRRRLAEKMIELANGSPRGPREPARRIAAVISRRDLPWLIEMFETLRDAKAREVVAWLVSWFFADGDAELFEKLFDLSESNTIFGEAFREHRDPVEWNSEEAQGLRRMYERQQRPQRSDETEVRTMPLSQERIAEHLEAIERDGARRFAGLTWQMMQAERDSSFSVSLPSSLAVLQGWKSANAATKERIIRAAREYALEGDPERDEWVGTSRVSWNAWAGYYAFLLIWDEARESAADLPEEVWLKWAPAIVSCFATDEDSSASDLIVAAYKRIPEGMIANLKIQIQFESKESGHLYILDRFEPCWNDRLATALVAMLNDETLTPKAIESLLHALLKHGVAEAVEFAKAQLIVPLPANDRGRGVALAAAKVLMMYAPEDGWSNVWSVVVADQSFGRALIFRLAEEMDFRFGKIFDQIGEGLLASLYAWISREFPPIDDSRSDRMLRPVGPRDLAQST